MSVELQGLIERIQNEGIEKANEQKEAILRDAKAEAERLLNEAKEQAENELKEAHRNAEALQKRAESAVRQSARDIVLSLRAELERRLNALVKQSIGAALTPQLMAQMLVQIAGEAQEQGELVLPKGTSEACLATLTESLRVKPEIVLRNDFSNGFKVGFKQNDVYLDFSDEALSALICAYVGPKVAAVLQGKD